MRNLLLVLAAVAMTTPAMASRARMSALGMTQSSNLAPHIKDVQTAFENPSDLLLIPDYATFEMGATTTGSVTAGAEGGFAMTRDNAKWGVYLGRKSAFTSTLRTVAGYPGQDNTIELQYAMNGPIKWGASFNYSASDSKSTAQKQNAMGVRLGMNADVYDAYLILGLGSSATGNINNASAPAPCNALASDPDSTLKGLMGMKVGGNYRMYTLNFFADYYMDGAKFESTVNAAASGLKIEQSQLTLGVLDRITVEGGEAFYGAALRQNQSKRSGANAALDEKTTAMSLPFFIGMEAGITPWLVARGSISQNVLYGTTKTETAAGGEADTIPNNTTVAAGLGFKMNKFILDGSIATASGDVNGNNVVSNAALTYNF